MANLTHLTLMTSVVAAICLIAGQTPAQSQPSGPRPAHVHVPTSSGLVRGLKSTLSSNQTVYKFLSVPYARAPSGPLRFKRPVELEQQSGALVDATKFAATCPQHRHLARFISPLLNLDAEHQISEDCLHLSIYVPDSVGATLTNDSTSEATLEAGARLPVIVWIPGEGFDFADARQFDGSHLAQRSQSVVVSVQYRVGLLGFLDAPQLNITGNMGLYDQVAALKWVKRNIGAFGGDDERVTLMGRFSGSMAISALLTAPEQRLVELEDGRPLFNRAALLSGLAVADWIIERHTQADKLEAVNRLALERKLCTGDQVRSGSCLLELPLERLVEISGYGWKLVADNELVARQDPIELLAENPRHLAANLDAILLGETETEGTLCLYRHMLDQRTDFAQLIDSNKLSPADLYELIRDDSLTYFKYNISHSNPVRTALEAITGHRRDEEAEPELRDKYLAACSSYMVKAHNGRFRRQLEARNQLIERTSAGKPVELHHYSLKYKPSFSLAPDYIRTAAHGDDVPLIFGLVHNQPRGSASAADLLATERLMSYIGNFVHGNHPLLQQHNSIEQIARSAAESEQVEPSGARLTRRLSWASTASLSQVHPIDLSDLKLDESRAAQNESEAAHVGGCHPTKEAHEQRQQPQTPAQQVVDKELRLVVADGQQAATLGASSDSLQWSATDTEVGESQPLTRSLRLLDLYRRRQQQQQAAWLVQQRSQLVLSTEGASGDGQLVPLLLLSSCLVVLTMMAICIALSVVVIKCYNCKTSSPMGSSSVARRNSAACNICEDVQMGAGTKGGERPFGSVFAKLRNHDGRARPQAPQTTPSQSGEGPQ